MKKNVLIFVLVGCLVLLASCITVVVPTEEPAPSQMPTPIPPTATQAPPSLTPAPTATPEPIPPSATPEPTAPALENAVVGFPPGGFVLYYDPTKWEAVPYDHTAGAWILVSTEFNGCTIKQLLGHGVDPNQTPLTTQMLTYNGITITYKVWRDKDTQLPAIVGYYWDIYNGCLEVFVKDNPEACLAAAQQVVEDSAAFGFAD